MSSPVLRSALAFAFVVCAAFSAADSARADGEVRDSSPAPLLMANGQSDFEMEFAKTVEISDVEAHRVFADSSAISNFIERHTDDPRFGALWVTYESGYQVHVRYLDETFQQEILALEESIGRTVLRVVGGASASTLRHSEALLKEARIPYEPDIAGGYLAIFDQSIENSSSLTPDEARDLPGVRVLPGAAPEYRTVETSRSGADVWYYNGNSWSTVCTAAAMWKGNGMTGYLSAAHCPNLVPNYTYVDGGYSHGTFPVITTACGPNGDYEFIRFSTPKNEHETFLDKRTNPNVETPFRVAGGYYVGQPSFKVGMTSNGTTGTNMGTIAGYATAQVGVSCAGVRPHLRYNHIDAPGDSGGPVFVFYNNEWYLAAIHNGYTTSGGGWRYGNAIWDVSTPPSTYICNIGNPCT